MRESGDGRNLVQVLGNGLVYTLSILIPCPCPCPCFRAIVDAYVRDKGLCFVLLRLILSVLANKKFSLWAAAMTARSLINFAWIFPDLCCCRYAVAILSSCHPVILPTASLFSQILAPHTQTHTYTHRYDQ